MRTSILAKALAIIIALFTSALTAPVALNGPGPSLALAQVPAANSGGPRVRSVLEVAPTQMRACLADLYRLRPDKRLLLAVAEIHHILTGANKESVKVGFEGGQWRLTYKRQEVGALSELPNFPDFSKLLENWARAVKQKRSLSPSVQISDDIRTEIGARIDAYAAPRLLSAIYLIDRMWNNGRYDPSLFLLATRALVSLNVQIFDRIGAADVLSAKALAVLTLSKVFADGSVDRYESLLAHLMGYSGHAENVAQGLDPADPIRSYVMGDGDRLKEIAGEENADQEAYYLWVLLCSKLGKVDELSRLLETYSGDPEWILSLIKAQLELRSFDVNASLAEVVPSQVALSAMRDAGRLHAPSESQDNSGSIFQAAKDTLTAVAVQRLPMSILVNKFEWALRRLSAKCSGPFLDTRCYEAYYVSYFYSALQNDGIHFLDSLASVGAAKVFADSLGVDGEGLAGEFQRWYRNLVESLEGKRNRQALAKDLVSLSRLGSLPLKRTFDELTHYTEYADPIIFSAAKSLVRRMDSRPSDRHYLLNIARVHLYDLRLSEKLFTSLVTVEPSRNWGLQVWYASLTNDRKQLIKLLESGRMPPQVQSVALEYLEPMEGVDTEFIENHYEMLIRKYPDSWTIRRSCCDFLRRIKKPGKARAVVEEWLEKNVTTLGLEKIFAASKIARTYLEEKQYEKAWEVIRPAIVSMQAGAMEIGAETLEKLNRPDEAEELATAIVSRYPDALHCRLLLADLYWRHGKHGQAAEVFKSSPQKITVEEWHSQIAPKFVEVFSDKSEEDLYAAFSELDGHSVDTLSLLRIPIAYNRKGKPEIAFGLVSRISARGTFKIVAAMHGYAYLEKVKGKEQALAWLRPQIPRRLLNKTSSLIYRQKKYDLLWDIIEKPEDGPSPEFVWLMRAAAHLRQGKSSNTRHERDLANYYESANDGWYQKIGRFLLGLTTEKEVLRMARGPKKCCEISYYIGLRALAEGRYEDASDWFRITVETGQNRNGEYTWAYDTLERWQRKRMSLRRLAAERL